MNNLSVRQISISYISTGTTLLLLMASASTAFAQNKGSVSANVGLIYPLSTNGLRASRDTNVISINAVAGISASERGLALAGVSNIVRHNASGFQLAGFSNHIKGSINGFTAAGAFNTYSRGSGVSMAGVANLAVNNTGTQVAGVFNKGGSASALQLAGFMNLTRELKGAQIAGLINIAKSSTGLQVGLVNIADSAGTQIGLINVAKNGQMALGFSIDETQTTTLSFRSGGKVFYGIIGIGYNLNNNSQKYAYQAGIGARLLNLEKFRLKTELIASGLESFKGSKYYKSSSYLMPAFRLGKSVEIFAGPSFNTVVTDTEEGRKLIKHYVSDWTTNNGRDFHGIYFGYTAGIQLNL